MDNSRLITYLLQLRASAIFGVLFKMTPRMELILVFPGEFGAACNRFHQPRLTNKGNV
jgi:hypothetical protein